MAPRLSAALLALAALTGCPKTGCDDSVMDTRTLDALEKERAREAGREDPNAKLANLAVAREHTSDRTVTLSAPEQRVGDVALRPVSLRFTKSIQGGKVALTTEERFVILTLALTSGPGAPDLSQAALSDGKDKYPVARDAQRLLRPGTPPTADDAGAKVAPPSASEIVLVFEVPETLPEGKLSLELSSGEVHLQ